MYQLNDELKFYKGTNEKPSDFDEFWENALNLAHNHELDYKIITADCKFENVECFHLYFKGLDGSKIHVKYLKPKSNRKNKAILQFHGYMYHCGSFSEKLAYASQGYSVFAMDTRGQGGQSEDLVSYKGATVFGHVIKGVSEGKENLYYKDVFLDSVILCKIICEIENIDQIFTMGLSQGGGLALACAALVPEVKKVAVQNPFLSDYKKVWELGIGREQYRLIDYFRLFDPLHEHEEEFFKTLGYIDVHNFASKIKSKVLFGTGVLDDICPVYTQMAIYNNLECDKKLKLYPDFSHEDMPNFWDEAIMFFNQEV